MTFLLAEDKALREKLQGMVVEDQKANSETTTRQVGVWFGQPDQEIRNQSYPYVTIDLISISTDHAREHRGTLTIPEYLAGDIPVEDRGKMNYPIPVSLTYQVTTYARHPRHDRQLSTQLLFEKFPLRFGYLEIVEKDVTVDDTETITSTFRRMDVTDVSKRDVTEQAKRLFVNVITVSVSSEVPLGALNTRNRVTSVNLHNPTLLTVIGRPGDPNVYGVGEVTITE